MEKIKMIVTGCFAAWCLWGLIFFLKGMTKEDIKAIFWFEKKKFIAEFKLRPIKQVVSSFAMFFAVLIAACSAVLVAPFYSFVRTSKNK